MMRSWPVALLSVVAWLVARCGSQSGSAGSGVADVEAHPFVVAPAPAGYRLVTAGRGTQVQDWGADSSGTDEPFTVLRGKGNAVMVVSVTGFEGYEGKLDQATSAYPRGREERFEVDGGQAIFTPTTGRGWTDLVVVKGADLAVRVSAPRATKAELVEVARRVQPAADHGTAPTVTDPPSAWHVVGSVDADAVLALRPNVLANTDEVPGSTSSFGAGWLADKQTLAAVMVLPAGSADLDALAQLPPLHGQDVTSRAVEVDGREGVAIDVCSCRDGLSYRTRAVVTNEESGALVAVVAAGEKVPALQPLVEMAASVRATDAVQWRRFVVEASGGPGLHPDVGEVELARGRVAGLDWLLQTANNDGPVNPEEPDAAVEAAPCLKLSNRKRICAPSGGGSPGEIIRMSSNDQPDPAFPGVPSFVVVTTKMAGAKVRVHTPSDTATGELHRLPRAGGWAGVVFVADPGVATCIDDPPPPEGLGVMRVEVLDASDQVVACLGLGAHPG